MIIQEFYEDKVKHYSDNGFLIKQIETGKQYEEAIDILPCKYTYTETEIKIPKEEMLEDISIENENNLT